MAMNSTNNYNWCFVGNGNIRKKEEPVHHVCCTTQGKLVQSARGASPSAGKSCSRSLFSEVVFRKWCGDKDSFGDKLTL